MAFAITIENSGEQFRCGAEVNLLEAMERSLCSGIPVGCRNGGCGACKVRVAAGRYEKRKMNRAVLTLAEEEDGCVLACKAYPQSDMRVSAIGDRARTAARKSASFSFEFATTQVQPDKER